MSATDQVAYRGLAIEAGRQAGLWLPTAQPADEEAAVKCVAANDLARETRDQLWTEYERMLADERTYTLDDVVEWLADRKTVASKSSVHRDRWGLLSKERVMQSAAAKSRAIVDAIGAGGEDDLFRATRNVAAQAVLNALLNFDEDTLAGLKAEQAIKLVMAVGKLSTSHAQSDLLAARLSELQGKLEAEKAKADQAAGETLQGVGVDAATIDRIRQIYGLPKLGELAA
jgi:hypothetical protein